jgi:predicted phage terminase large subunit-like protein
VKDYFFNNLMNLLEPDGRVWCLFTPWHRDDLNAHLMPNSAFALLRRPIPDTLEPIWPEHWPRERLQQRQAEIGLAAFARGYRLITAVKEEVLIPPECIHFWEDEIPATGQMTVLSVDPAVSDKPRADATALVTIQRHGASSYHVVEAIAKRVRSQHLIRAISDADARWQPDVILFESNAAFAGMRDMLVTSTHFGPKIRGVQQVQSKAARFESLAIAVANGALRLRGHAGAVHPSQRQLWDEMSAFPFAEHDDLLDATATALAYFLRSPPPRVW